MNGSDYSSSTGVQSRAKRRMSSETSSGREDVLNDDELYRLRWHNVGGGQLERCWVDIHGQVRQRQRRRQ